MKFVTVSLFAITTLLAACAQSPESIVPVSMGNAFAATTCNDAMNMRNQSAANLVSLEQRQRNAVSGDAIGVFLIGVPMSSLSGNDVAGQIAAERGKVIALDARLSSCNVRR